jgi:hypothetical protein
MKNTAFCSYDFDMLNYEIFFLHRSCSALNNYLQLANHHLRMSSFKDYPTTCHGVVVGTSVCNEEVFGSNPSWETVYSEQKLQELY